MTDANTPDPAAVAAPEPEEIPVEVVEGVVTEDRILDDPNEPEWMPHAYNVRTITDDEEDEPSEYLWYKDKLMIAAVIVTLLAAMIAGCFLVSTIYRSFTTPKIVEKTPEATATPTVTPQVEEPPALLPEGVETWQDVLAHIKANDPVGYGEFVTRITGLTTAEIEGLAALEKSGYVLKVKVPKGTVLTNTGLQNGFQVYPGFVLKTDREALTTPDGKPQVLTHCGNPIGRPTKEAEKPTPPKKVEKCPPAAPGFTPRTPTGGSKVFQQPQENQTAARASDPATAIVRGIPDAIQADQTARSGTVVPTPSGAVSPVPPPAGTPVDDGAGDVTSGTVPSQWGQ